MTFHCSPMIMRRSTQWFSRGALIVAALSFAACERQASPPSRSPTFDQEVAYHLLLEVCNFGPRNHGSQSKRAAEKWIQSKLNEAGAEVSVHEFNYEGKHTQATDSFRNIIGRIRPLEKKRIMIGTHYDTRSWAEHDSHPELRATPLIGANDGGSGTAVLLEMAAAWKDNPPPVGVDLIFFDGEDFGKEGALDDYFVGSKAWVRDHPDFKPEWGVILDMVGDSTLEIQKEKLSAARACSAMRKVWAAAQRMDSVAFGEGFTPQIYDDHTAFTRKRIPVALVIDLDYPWYHTVEDLPDKCSAASLGQVGRAVMEAVNSERPQ